MRIWRTGIPSYSSARVRAIDLTTRSSSAHRVAVMTTLVSSWKRAEMEPSHSSRCLRLVVGEPASSMFLITSSTRINWPGLPVIPPPIPADSIPPNPREVRQLEMLCCAGLSPRPNSSLPKFDTRPRTRTDQVALL